MFGATKHVASVLLDFCSVNQRVETVQNVTTSHAASPDPVMLTGSCCGWLKQDGAFTALPCHFTVRITYTSCADRITMLLSILTAPTTADVAYCNSA